MSARRFETRRLAATVVAVFGVVALAACSANIATVDQAQAQVKAKEQALSEAEAAFTSASQAFCDDAQDYVLALDRYGDVLHATAPTVGDVQDAGSDLAEPRDDAYDGAQAALDAQQAVLTAEQELADAQTTLARLEAGVSGTPSPVARSAFAPTQSRAWRSSRSPTRAPELLRTSCRMLSICSHRVSVPWIAVRAASALDLRSASS